LLITSYRQVENKRILYASIEDMDYILVTSDYLVDFICFEVYDENMHTLFWYYASSILYWLRSEAICWWFSFSAFQVDAMLQKLEKEIDDVDARIGNRWQLLDR